MKDLKLILAALLFTAIQAVATSIEHGREKEPRWTELTYKNFEDTIQAHDYTVVLVYDPKNERNLYEHTLILEGMQEKAGLRDNSVGFARLNGRHHSKIREMYTKEGEGLETRNDLFTVTSETFLDVSLGSAYWPTQFWILASNYNLYDKVDMIMIPGSIPIKTVILEKWLAYNAANKADEIRPYRVTRANIEKELKLSSEENDNTFDFEAYESAQAEKMVSNQDKSLPNNIRLLLETDSKDNGRPSNDGPFSYGLAWVNKLRTSKGYMEMLGKVIDEYLAWVEGYETTWSEERKEREDEQTDFGFYLNIMNQQIQDLFDRLLRKNPKVQLDGKVMRKLRKREDYYECMQVPNLRGYLEEAVFGPGRSVTSWRHFMEDMKTGLGETPEERRQHRHDFDSSTLPIVSRMREHFSLLSEVDEDDTYSIILADLYSSWHNILTDFHENLSQHYLRWLKDNPRATGNKFQMDKMDVIDMKDSKDREMLTNYDHFHGNYTEPGTPVILSNVELTTEAMTLDYIVNQCSASDVTQYVQISRKVGERQASGDWGGLLTYELDEELMTPSRKEQSETTKSSLTMQQFAVLAEQLDHLYLHDYWLPKQCDSILFEDTPYGRNQKFKIPSAIGSYDLFQRLTKTKYGSSWPSLFVGKKGSNSKLHIDNGATGFFMYLVSGRKRWVVYKRNERPFLYKKINGAAIYPDVLGMGKNQESDEFLSQRFPLLHRAEAAYEIIQEPGQLVYIPPSCPHAVENLEDSIGLAMNFVSKQGLANHLHSELHKKMDFAAIDAAMKYWLFEDNAGKPVATEDPLYTTYGEFKSQY